MKISAIFCLFLFLSVSSFAQDNSDKVFYIMKVEKYKRMRNAGAILTIGGAALTIAGVSTLSKSSTDYYYYNGQQQTNTTGNPETGAVEFLVGVAGLGVGVPLWIVGSHAKNKYERKLDNVSVGLNFKGGSTGLRFAYRF